MTLSIKDTFGLGTGLLVSLTPGAVTQALGNPDAQADAVVFNDAIAHAESTGDYYDYTKAQTESQTENEIIILATKSGNKKNIEVLHRSISTGWEKVDIVISDANVPFVIGIVNGTSCGHANSNDIVAIADLANRMESEAIKQNIPRRIAAVDKKPNGTLLERNTTSFDEKQPN